MVVLPYQHLLVGPRCSRPPVLRVLHSAVPRIISRTPWDVKKALAWCRHVVYILLSTRDRVFFKLCGWLQNQAVWSSNTYASWHMPHPQPCSTFCANWCWGFYILEVLTPLQNPATPIGVGLSPWGGAIAELRTRWFDRSSRYGLATASAYRCSATILHPSMACPLASPLTERYLWSFRLLMSQFASRFLLTAACSFGGGGVTVISIPALAYMRLRAGATRGWSVCALHNVYVGKFDC